MAWNYSQLGILNWRSKPKTIEIPDWPKFRPVWTEESLNTLLQEAENTDEENVTLESILEKSEKFPIKFPIDSIRCKILSQLVSNQVLEKYINSVYPVIHENILPLLVSFLHHKRTFGNCIERKFYQYMTVLELVDRLLIKRAVTFANCLDSYTLIDGKKGFGKWETIGTELESDKQNLQKCLSYDELKLSAFLSVSSYTSFINDGNRYNRGVTNNANVEDEGIIIGLIGTRLEKPKVMEYAEILITEFQNSECNGYGVQSIPTLKSIFSEFYEEMPLTYKEAVEMKASDNNRFYEVEKGVLFDNNVYCKRLMLSIETLLFEANQRARDRQTTAYVHVVGLGLGVWKISPHQNALFLDACVKRIALLGNHLHAVSDVVFAYFGQNVLCGDYCNEKTILIEEHPNKGITVHLLNREPHSKLVGKHEGKLLVVSYAWDSNALPGNEFWYGSLAGSGDPAAASSTQVAELHNAHINKKVSGKYLRIACDVGVVPFSRYREVAQLTT